MNLYMIGIKKGDNEGHYAVLAPKKEDAETYVKKYFNGGTITYSKTCRHGNYIVAFTFLNSEFES